MIRHFTVILLLLALAASCAPGSGEVKQTISEADSDSTFLRLYGGVYSVEIEGVPPSSAREVFVLAGDGTGKWMLMVSDGPGARKIENEFDLRWRAVENRISITIMGTGGEKIEEYEYRNGEFVNTEKSKRYLKANG